eukprot:UN25032
MELKKLPPVISGKLSRTIKPTHVPWVNEGKFAGIWGVGMEDWNWKVNLKSLSSKSKGIRKPYEQLDSKEHPNIRNVVFKMLDPLAYHQEFEDWKGDEPTFKKVLELEYQEQAILSLASYLYSQDPKNS